jgi:hypothetical protein
MDSWALRRLRFTRRSETEHEIAPSHRVVKFVPWRTLINIPSLVGLLSEYVNDAYIIAYWNGVGQLSPPVREAASQSLDKM